MILSSVLALAAIKAQEIDRDDYPPACQNECFSLVNTTESCDDSTDGDTNYLSCVCGSTDASSRLVACGTCIRSNGGDSDNEAIELALKCGFAIPASSSSGGGPSSTTPAASTASLSTTTLANGVMSSSAQSNAREYLGSTQIRRCGPKLIPLTSCCVYV